MMLTQVASRSIVLPMVLTIGAAVFIGLLLPSMTAGDIRPTLATVLVLGLAAFTPYFLRNIHWLIVAFVASLPLGVLAQLQEIDYEGTDGTPLLSSTTQILSLFVVGIWGMRMLARNEGLRFPRVLLSFLAFLAFETLASLASNDPIGSLTFLARFYAPLTVFLIVFASSIRTAAHYRAVLWAVVLSLAFVSALQLAHVAGIINVPGLYTIEESGRGRVGGTHGGLASTSFHLMIGILIAVELWRHNRTPRIRLLLAGCLLAMAVSNLLAASISGSVALALSLGLLLSNAGALSLRDRRLSLVIVRTLGVAGIVVALMLLGGPLLLERLESKVEDTRTLSVYDFGSGRVTTVLGTVMLVLDHPLGVGAGNVGPTLPPYLAPYLAMGEDVGSKFGVPQMDPHNTLLMAAGEAGVAGMVALLIGCVAAFRRMRRLLRTEGRRAGHAHEIVGIGHSLVIVALATVFFGFTSDQLFDKYLWLIIALLVTYPYIFTDALASPVPTHPQRQQRSSVAARQERWLISSRHSTTTITATSTPRGV